MRMAENGTKRKHSDDENGGGISKKVRPVKESGTLLYSGLTNYNLRYSKDGFKNVDELKWSAHRYEALEGIKIKEVSSGPVAYFTLAITDEGAVYAWGLNERGQLGLGDCHIRKNPTLVESMSGHNVVAVSAGRQHCLMLTDDGDVYACGDNKCGQSALGPKKDMTNLPVKVTFAETVKSVVCGDEYSLILSDDGKIYSFGSPEHGQLGHGSENKEISGKGETFHYEHTPVEIETFIEIDEGEVVSHGQPTITFIAAGLNHSCAIDDQQRLFTWGFGGYGRLGHNDTKNEMRPRLMKCWYRLTGRADGGITKVWCGGQFNLVDTIIDKCKYMFGQFHTNAEANMYPKFMDDLQGWNCRDIVCSRYGYTICADDSVIGSAPSPGFGTLAMGEKKKSSSQPMLLTSFKDVYCLRAGLGYMHACFIVRDKSEKDRQAIEKFPTMTFDDTFDDEVEDKNGSKKKGKAKPKPKPKPKATKKK